VQIESIAVRVAGEFNKQLLQASDVKLTCQVYDAQAPSLTVFLNCLRHAAILPANF
jgi:hypothetical protein